MPRKAMEKSDSGIIEKFCGAKNIPEFQSLSPEVQNEAVRIILDAGASV